MRTIQVQITVSAVVQLSDDSQLSAADVVHALTLHANAYSDGRYPHSTEDIQSAAQQIATTVVQEALFVHHSERLGHNRHIAKRNAAVERDMLTTRSALHKGGELACRAEELPSGEPACCAECAKVITDYDRGYFVGQHGPSAKLERTNPKLCAECYQRTFGHMHGCPGSTGGQCVCWNT
jgi:hypothetical protein